jgi:hypothetical protein
MQGLASRLDQGTVNDKAVYLHVASNVVTTKRPMHRDAFANRSKGIKRPLTAYASFMQIRFERQRKVCACRLWHAPQ